MWFLNKLYIIKLYIIIIFIIRNYFDINIYFNYIFEYLFNIYLIYI